MAKKNVGKLVVESGPQSGHIFDLPPGERADIGRSRTCVVRVEGEGISRVHSTIEPDGSRLVLRDHDSRNGTYVNDERVSEKTLEADDVIRVGEVSLKFQPKEQDPLIGKTLAGYRVEERLGHGGMGTVYRAVQVSMDRTVALKILSRALSEDRAFVSRFVQEARSAARVTHPQVVQVHNVGHFDKLFYISMEFLPGGSLQDLIREEGRLAPERALVMALQATRALMWAEKHGIVHRDIKPANLMIDAAGRIKVADFGIAADIQKSKTLQQGGMVVGSPEYMAPEQAVGNPVDHRADIYGLGSTLYAALRGRAPFTGATPKEIILTKVKQPPEPLTDSVPGLPEELVDAVKKMMAPRASDRFQNAQELYRALSSVLKTMQEDATASQDDIDDEDDDAPETPETPKKGRIRRRHGGLLETRTTQVHPVIAVACVVLLALGIGWWVFFRNSEPPTRPVGTGIDVAAKQIRARPSPKKKKNLSASIKPQTVSKKNTPKNVVERNNTALAALVEREIKMCLLESRFDAAMDRLRRFGRENPQAGKDVAMEIERVRAAESLYNARLQAMELVEKGELETARSVLTRIKDKLPPKLKLEAELAIQSLSQE